MLHTLHSSLLEPPHDFRLLDKQNRMRSVSWRRAEEVWIPVLAAEGKEEQRVLSGAWLGQYQLTQTDIPR